MDRLFREGLFKPGAADNFRLPWQKPNIDAQPARGNCAIITRSCIHEACFLEIGGCDALDPAVGPGNIILMMSHHPLHRASTRSAIDVMRVM